MKNRSIKCPVCVIPLIIADRQGIEVDYCEKCRGVWLERGELDKVIARHAAPENDGEDEGRLQSGRRRERENPLTDIFDFF